MMVFYFFLFLKTKRKALRNTNTNETENANKYIYTQRHIYFRHSVWKWKPAASEGRYDPALGVLLLYSIYALSKPFVGITEFRGDVRHGVLGFQFIIFVGLLVSDFYSFSKMILVVFYERLGVAKWCFVHEGSKSMCGNTLRGEDEDEMARA